MIEVDRYDVPQPDGLMLLLRQIAAWLGRSGDFRSSRRFMSAAAGVPADVHVGNRRRTVYPSSYPDRDIDPDIDRYGHACSRPSCTAGFRWPGWWWHWLLCGMQDDSTGCNISRAPHKPHTIGMGNCASYHAHPAIRHLVGCDIRHCSASFGRSAADGDRRAVDGCARRTGAVCSYPGHPPAALSFVVPSMLRCSPHQPD